MVQLTSEQRNALYLQEAGRAGIHKSLLAALYAVHSLNYQTVSPAALGIEMDSYQTFAHQVQYAANVIRALGDRLIAQQWQGNDLWYPAWGRYSDRFLELLADGFTPALEETEVGALRPCDVAQLKAAYITDIEQTWLPEMLADLDDALLKLVEQLPEFYWGLEHQRHAFLEAVRVWRNLNTTEAAIESLAQETQKSLQQFAPDELDITLKQFVQRACVQYQYYPHQREALVRLVQYWRQLPSREATLLDILRDPQPHANLHLLDATLLHFVRTLPTHYKSKGIQRNAVAEAFRIWQQLDSRSTAVTVLGIDAEILTCANPEPTVLIHVAQELDRALLSFIDRVPEHYQGTHQHREALIRLVQLWRELPSREQTLHTLVADHQHLAQTVPELHLTATIAPRSRPWTPDNLELNASIIPDGGFTWAHATQCGTALPNNQRAVDAIVAVATLLERAQRQIGLPFLINRWYQTAIQWQNRDNIAEQHHVLGDAVEFICPGLDATQIYWTLDPWWPGGLGRYQQYSALCHVDARPYRARWQQD